MEVTEKDLKRIIKGMIEEYFRTNSNHFIRMAIECSEYSRKADKDALGFFRLVLLIAYCSLYDRENQFLDRWKSEVWYYCFHLTVNMIWVGKLRQEEAKRKVLHHLWFEQWECHTDRMINSLWHNDRFESINRGIDFNFKVTHEMKEKYTSIIYCLIDVIAKSDKRELERYTDSL
jgi:hypothetical protein